MGQWWSQPAPCRHPSRVFFSALPGRLVCLFVCHFVGQFWVQGSAPRFLVRQAVLSRNDREFLFAWTIKRFIKEINTEFALCTLLCFRTILCHHHQEPFNFCHMQPLGNSAFEKLHDKDSRSRLVLLNKHSIFIVGAFRMSSSYSKTKALDEMNRWRWCHLCLCGGWTSPLWICDSFLQQDLSSGEILEILIILIDKSWWHTHTL